MTREHSWLKFAACRDHEELAPDAWFSMRSGVPHGEGAAAMRVCRNECPVRGECLDYMVALKATNQIGGGGWFNGSGKFREPAYNRRGQLTAKEKVAA